MVEGSREVLWLPEGRCRTASRREDYVKELARFAIRHATPFIYFYWLLLYTFSDAYAPKGILGPRKEVANVPKLIEKHDSCQLLHYYHLMINSRGCTPNIPDRSMVLVSPPLLDTRTQLLQSAYRHIQVDAYGPDDKEGRGRECSSKGWCGDNRRCLVASSNVMFQ